MKFFLSKTFVRRAPRSMNQLAAMTEIPCSFLTKENMYRPLASEKSYLFTRENVVGFSSREPTSKLNYKPKAYINPQVLNCEYIKKSCINISQPSVNKIHVNPNFKRNDISKLINNNLQVHGSSSSQPNTVSIKPSIHSETSQFKKINTPAKIKSVSKFTWSKANSNSNSKNVSSSYKYRASEKPVLKISTNDKKPIFKSKTKLVNKISDLKSSLKFKEHPPVKKQNLSKFKYYKSKFSPVVKVARVVKNKYKYTKSPRKKLSKYKLDKRKKSETGLVKLCTTKEKDIRKLFPKNIYKVIRSFSSGVKISQPYQRTTRNLHVWRKNGESETSNKKINQYPNRRVVKIGGILYKSTAHKLTLANAVTSSNSKKLSASKANKDHIVYVRGEKFILDKNGKTLRRHSQNPSVVKRIDIGGVTYLQKSQNVLVRTNVHQARHFVNKAKHRSIATLTKLHKRSSMPCMIFHRFGKCMRHSKGLCMYKHDPKNVAICKKFLKGNCTTPKCLLSHSTIQEKMATCHFFLNGFCSRENCPFPHVKLSEKAAICENFLRGFCQLGKNCSKRHLYVCPEFEKTGTCKQGTKCHFPHKSIEKHKDHSPASGENVKSEDLQYYVKPIQPKPKVKKVKKNDKKIKRKLKDTVDGSEVSESTIECVPKRVKLDELPCFIPLKFDS